MWTIRLFYKQFLFNLWTKFVVAGCEYLSLFEIATNFNNSKLVNVNTNVILIKYTNTQIHRVEVCTI